MGAQYTHEAQGKGAIITGGGSGIGKEVVKRCLSLGMFVVIADINEAAIKQTTQQLGAKQGQVLGVKTDVSNEEDYLTLKEKSLAFFGTAPIGFVFLNAGISLGYGGWDSAFKGEINDFKRVIEVDLLSVVLGFRVFVPVLLDQKSKSLLVTTASVSGLMASRDVPAAYTSAKYGALLYTEYLKGYLLENKISNLNCHVLCPFMTATPINDHAPAPIKSIRCSVEVCVDRLLAGIEKDIFYIVTPDLTADVHTIGSIHKLKLDSLLLGGAPHQQLYGNKEQNQKTRAEYRKELERGKYAGLLGNKPKL